MSGRAVARKKPLNGFNGWLSSSKSTIKGKRVSRKAHTKFIAIGNRRWIEQSLVRRRTDSSRGEFDVKIMSAKPSSSSIARRSGRSTLPSVNRHVTIVRVLYRGFPFKLHHELPSWVEDGALFHIRILSIETRRRDR